MGVIEARRRILLSAPHVEATTPAGVANFQTDLISPLKSLKAGFLPVQSGSGDPSPSNVRPISGWSGLTVYKAGANLFDKNAAVRKDGYTINYGGGEEASTTSGFFENYTPIKPSTTYTVSGSGIRVPLFYGKDKQFVWRPSGQNTPFVFTSPDNAYYVRFQYLMESLDVDTVQLELGSTATTYSPYTGTTIPVTFPAAGKNLYNPATDTPRAFVRAQNGTIGAIEATSGNYSATDFIPVTPGATYTINYNASSTATGAGMAYYSAKDVVSAISGVSLMTQTHVSGTAQTYYTFTVPNDCHFIRFSTFPESSNVQLELGSTATSYEPYRNAYYGGYVDLVRGDVVAEYADYVFTGDENWQASSTPNRFFIYMTLERQMAIQTTVSNAEQNVYTDMFGRCVYKNADGVAYFVTNSSIRQIVVNTQAASSVSDIKQLTTGMQMVYELETPIHYPLTPQIIKSLRGTNNIWSDANGDMSVEYWKH